MAENRALEALERMTIEIQTRQSHNEPTPILKEFGAKRPKDVSGPQQLFFSAHHLSRTFSSVTSPISSIS